MGVLGLDRVRHCVPKEGESWGPVLSYLPGEEVMGTMGILGRSFKTPLPLTGPCSSPLPYKQQPHADGGTWHELPAKPSVIRLPRRWRPLSGGGPNSQGSVPGEWEGRGLRINLVFNFLGYELPRSEPSGRRGPCQSAVTVYHGQPHPHPRRHAGGVGRLRLVQPQLL